ncbi:MAG: hypothetical protein SX243_04820 [Acidobacteriota bacterium]|nr:hypothetical protein [Acidobacteriota bacterium]
MTAIELPRREGLEKSLAEARWQFGGLRVDPWLAVENLSYLNDVFSGSDGPETSDVTATAGAGLRAFLPVGPDTIIAGYALPQYIYWQDLEERRQLVGRYGAGVFTYFNRATLEVMLSSHEEQRFASSEFTQLAVSQRDRLEVVGEVRLVRSLWLTAAGETSELRYQVDDLDEIPTPQFSLLNRDEEVTRIGLRAQLRGGWDVSLGLESFETDFIDPGLNLSNSGDSPYLSIRFQEDEQGVLVSLLQRKLDPEPGSIFVPFDELVGNATWNQPLSARFTFSLFAARQLGYSLINGYSHTLEDRVGLALAWSWNRRLSFQVSAEQGESSYQRTLMSTAAERQDDIQATGLRISWQILPKLSLGVGYSRTEFDSNLPRFDRELDQITTSINLGGIDWP